MKITQWYCPYVDKKYTGKCPVISCPANTDKHDSGCLHSLYKEEFTVTNLSLILDKSISNIEEKYNKGLEAVKCIFELKKYISSTVINKNACQQCGTLNCKLDELCEKRTTIINDIKQKYPFTIKELNSSTYVISKIITAQALTFKHHRIKQSVIKRFNRELP